MNYIRYAFKKFYITIFFSFLLFSSVLKAQAPVLRTTNSFTEQPVLYNTDSFMHTSWKPALYTDSTYQKSDQTWFYRKFFEEHLVQVQQSNFNIFADPIFDEYIGASKRAIPTKLANVINPSKTKTIFMNTRGYELSGNIGDKFYFQTDFYENQGRFPGYVDSAIRTSGVIPFQNSYKDPKKNRFDFSYSSANLIYVPNKHLLFNLGYGTNSIGDGYRSLLLGDYNTNYPFFRTAINFGRVQYSVMYSQYISNQNSYTYAEGYPRKWGQTYLLDWSVTKQFNIGVFNAVVSSIEDDDHKRDFGAMHLSPVIFLHGKKSPSGLSNNDIYGVNLKYKIIPTVTVYAQGMADKSGSADWEKRYGFQVGVRAGNLFKVEGLNAQAEFNTVRPYSYASDTITTAYTHYNQPLAHPLGANFKEGVFVADYNYKRWWIRVEVMAARYGVDTSLSTDFGQNIYKPLYLHTTDQNVSIGQGLRTKLYYGDARIAYIINRKSNFRIEAGGTYRTEKNRLNNYKDIFVYAGVRFSFRKLIYDF